MQVYLIPLHLFVRISFFKGKISAHVCLPNTIKPQRKKCSFTVLLVCHNAGLIQRNVSVNGKIQFLNQVSKYNILTHRVVTKF